MLFWKETSVTMTSWSYLSWWYWESFRHLFGHCLAIFPHLSSFNSSSFFVNRSAIKGWSPAPKDAERMGSCLGNEMKGESLSVWASMIRYLSCPSLLQCSLEPVLPPAWVLLAASLFQQDLEHLFPVAPAIVSGRSSLNSFPLRLGSRIPCLQLPWCLYVVYILFVRLGSHVHGFFFPFA